MILAVAHWAVGGASLVERFETLDDEEVVLRSSCVGSIFGVVETRVMGEVGELSNRYSWSMYPLTGS
jgi:hypothetical protein